MNHRVSGKLKRLRWQGNTRHIKKNEAHLVRSGLWCYSTYKLVSRPGAASQMLAEDTLRQKDGYASRTASGASITSATAPCPQGVMRTGLYGFLDTEWASCVTGKEHCAREFCCVLLRIVQTCSMSQRETLLQPSRLTAANSTPEKWPGQGKRGPCILAKTSRMCWSLRE